jgi:hypothetical protein
MKIKDLSKKILWFVLGAVFVGFLSFVSGSDAQQSKLVKLLMRFGEERVLEDGTKVGVSKGEGDLIVVTLSKNGSSPPSVSPSTSTKLRLGTYKGAATTTNQFTGTLRIKIKSVDEEGNVKADLRASNGLYGEGSLTGKVDAMGNLRLDGEIVTTLYQTTRWRITVTALVEDNALVKGKYREEAIGTGTEGAGEFYRLVLEEDF